MKLINLIDGDVKNGNLIDECVFVYEKRVKYKYVP